MSLSVVSASLSNRVSFLEEAPTGQIVLRNSRVLKVRDVTEERDLDFVRKIAFSWKEIAQNLLQESLQSFQESLDYYDLDGKECEQINQDEILVYGFQNLIDSFSYHAGQQLLGFREDRIKVITDQDQSIQGVCRAELQEEIYVQELFTAPWNLRFLTQGTQSYSYHATKGVGAILLASLYKDGHKLGKRDLRLLSLGSSVAYYQDHLKMQQDLRNPRHFSYPISQTGELPFSLKTVLRRSFLAFEE